MSQPNAVPSAECREAFEETFKAYYIQHGFLSSKDEAWQFFQSAWNRRPPPPVDSVEEGK